MVGKDATEGGLISANAELRHMLESMEAISDVKAPAEYRKDVVVTLFNRAVMDAVQRIRGARSEGVRRV
jgi:CO/xanthine dehydrogenase FAD-binding subunit